MGLFVLCVITIAAILLFLLWNNCEYSANGKKKINEQYNKNNFKRTPSSVIVPVPPAVKSYSSSKKKKNDNLDPIENIVGDNLINNMILADMLLHTEAPVEHVITEEHNRNYESQHHNYEPQHTTYHSHDYGHSSSHNHDYGGGGYSGGGDSGGGGGSSCGGGGDSGGDD